MSVDNDKIDSHVKGLWFTLVTAAILGGYSFFTGYGALADDVEENTASIALINTQLKKISDDNNDIKIDLATISSNQAHLTSDTKQLKDQLDRIEDILLRGD